MNRQPKTAAVTRWHVDTENTMPPEAPFDGFEPAWKHLVALARKYRETSGRYVCGTVYDRNEGTIKMRLDPDTDETITFAVLPVTTVEEMVDERDRD